jgi:hypothetical protein
MLRFREFVENYDELDERAWTPAQRRRAKVMMKKNKAKLVSAHACLGASYQRF